MQGSPVSIDTSNSFTVSPPHAASSDVPCAIAQSTKNLSSYASVLLHPRIVSQHHRIPNLTPTFHNKTSAPWLPSIRHTFLTERETRSPAPPPCFTPATLNLRSPSVPHRLERPWSWWASRHQCCSLRIGTQDKTRREGSVSHGGPVDLGAKLDFFVSGVSSVAPVFWHWSSLLRAMERDEECHSKSKRYCSQLFGTALRFHQFSPLFITDGLLLGPFSLFVFIWKNRSRKLLSRNIAPLVFSQEDGDADSRILIFWKTKFEFSIFRIFYVFHLNIDLWWLRPALFLSGVEIWVEHPSVPDQNKQQIQCNYRYCCRVLLAILLVKAAAEVYVVNSFQDASDGNSFK